MNDFKTRFTSFDNARLFSIILDPKDYQSQAIETGRSVLKARGLEKELNTLLSQQPIGQEAQDQHEFDQL